MKVCSELLEAETLSSFSTSMCQNPVDIRSIISTPRCTWKLELGVQVQVTVSRLQSHSSRLQRSSRPLYTLARAAATTTSITTTSRDMAPRPGPHHRTITIMALTAPWLLLLLLCF